MSEHAITFEELADWLDGKLEPAARERVEAHLASGCASCRGDLAWLRRFKEAGRLDGFVQPPARLVAGAKASYRARRARPRAWLRRRLTPALGALLVAAIAVYLVCTPTVFARSAAVGGAPGALQASPAEGTAARPLGPGDRLAEGERIEAAREATVALFDGTTLTMQPGAEVAFTSLRSGLFGVARQVVLYQAAGTVRYDVPPMAGGLAALRVQSPSGTVAVHGTCFVVSVGPGPVTTVEVLAGVVAVSGALDSATLAEGEAASLGPGAPIRVRLRATPAATPGARARGASRPSVNPVVTGSFSLSGSPGASAAGVPTGGQSVLRQ